jgi:phosphoserine phosphatase
MTSSLRLVVSIDDQNLTVLREGIPVREFAISTATKGMGFTENSNRTPTGRFRISEKIGTGAPVGTIFRARVPVGIWTPGEAMDEDLVLTRILRLDGLEPENANTRQRFIYIHGTNRADLIGRPASHGCIRLENQEMIELEDMVSEGDTVEILPATRRRGKLLFIECDFTLCSLDGINELAGMRGESLFRKVCALSEAALDGRMPVADSLESRMRLITPDRAMCELAAAGCIDSVTPGASSFIRRLKDEGWLPVMLSGGLMPVVSPLAGLLGIEYVEAVPLDFQPDGSYLSYGSEFPTANNHGKAAIIREWVSALLPQRVVMIGNSLSDLETKGFIDVFIAFEGVVRRPRIAAEAGWVCHDWADSIRLLEVMEGAVSESGNA